MKRQVKLDFSLHLPVVAQRGENIKAHDSTAKATWNWEVTS